jgi:hypothetical protein
MARIAKSEHATIQRLAEVEGKKVPEIAATYGCTPANIYAILTRLRRPSPDAANDAAPVAAESEAIAASEADEAESGAELLPTPFAATPTEQAPLDLIIPATSGRKARAAREGQKRKSMPDQAAAPESIPLLDVAETAPMQPPAPPPLPAPVATTSTKELPTAQTASRSAKGPRLKGGYGLWTRSPEGDDSIMPFRSLEDLLSAVKPILRASANAPEPVWFSIQPMDLAEIDLETL